MAYTTSTSSFSLFPIALATPGAFTLFTTPSTPRDNHELYGDLRVAFHPTTNQPTQQCKRSASGSSIKDGLFKMFGGL